MSDYCFVIDDQKGVRLRLSADGVQGDSADLAARLKKDDYRHVEDRPIGSCIVHIFERTMPGTDIVPSDRAKQRL